MFDLNVRSEWTKSLDVHECRPTQTLSIIQFNASVFFWMSRLLLKSPVCCRPVFPYTFKGPLRLKIRLSSSSADVAAK